MAQTQSAHPGHQRTRMTFWSRHDPVIMSLHNNSNNHWSIMRTKSAAMPRLSTAEIIQSTKEWSKSMSADSRDFQQVDFQSRMKQLQADGDGRFDPKGVSVFSSVPTRNLHGNIPGNYTYLGGPRPKSSRSLLRTSYNEKARQGNKYWYQERPKPTSFGRYGIGAYKTLLGLGSAPRT